MEIIPKPQDIPDVPQNFPQLLFNDSCGTSGLKDHPLILYTITQNFLKNFLTILRITKWK